MWAVNNTEKACCYGPNPFRILKDGHNYGDYYCLGSVFKKKSEVKKLKHKARNISKIVHNSDIHMRRRNLR